MDATVKSHEIRQCNSCEQHYQTQVFGGKANNDQLCPHCSAIPTTVSWDPEILINGPDVRSLHNVGHNLCPSTSESLLPAMTPYSTMSDEHTLASNSFSFPASHSSETCVQSLEQLLRMPPDFSYPQPLSVPTPPHYISTNISKFNDRTTSSLNTCIGFDHVLDVISSLGQPDSDKFHASSDNLPLNTKTVDGDKILNTNFTPPTITDISTNYPVPNSSKQLNQNIPKQSKKMANVSTHFIKPYPKTYKAKTTNVCSSTISIPDDNFDVVPTEKRPSNSSVNSGASKTTDSDFSETENSASEEDNSPLLIKVKRKLDLIKSKHKSAQAVNSKLKEKGESLKKTYADILHRAKNDAKQKIDHINADLHRIEIQIKEHRENTLKENSELQSQLENVISQMKSLKEMGENVCSMQLMQNDEQTKTLQTNVLNHIAILPDESKTLLAAEKHTNKNFDLLYVPISQTKSSNVLGYVRGLSSKRSERNRNNSVSVKLDGLAIKSPTPTRSDMMYDSDESNSSSVASTSSFKRDSDNLFRGSKNKGKNLLLYDALMSPKPEEIEISDEEDLLMPDYSKDKQNENINKTIGAFNLNKKQSENISCRRSETVLTEFCTNFPPVLVKEFNLKNFYTRICYFDECFYCACFNKNCIDIYTCDGIFAQSVSCGIIRCPRVIQPLFIGSESTCQQLLVAAYSGLYTMDVGVRWKIKRFLKGMFRDVHLNGDICAALEKGSKEEHDSVVVFRKSSLKENHRFTLGLDAAWSIIVTDDSLYVSSGTYISANCSITKYTHAGQIINSFGNYGRTLPGELCTPYLCMIDPQENLLVADHLNNKFQVLSRSGQWTILEGLKLKYPSDAIIVNSYIYVTDLNNVLVYKFQ